MTFVSAQGEALSGLRVLVIAIDRNSPGDAYFVAGRATCDGEVVQVHDHTGASIAAVRAPEQALRTFDPELLPVLIVPPVLTQLANLIGDLDGCVVVFSDSPLISGLKIKDPFFGLIAGGAGEPHLMQGEPEYWDDDE